MSSEGNLVPQEQISSHVPEHPIYFPISRLWCQLLTQKKCPRKGHISWQWTTWPLSFPAFSWNGVEKMKRKKLLWKMMLTHLFLKGQQSIFQNISLSGIRSIQDSLEQLVYSQLWVKCKAHEFLQVTQEVKVKGWWSTQRPAIVRELYCPRPEAKAATMAKVMLMDTAARGDTATPEPWKEDAELWLWLE